MDGELAEGIQFSGNQQRNSSHRNSQHESQNVTRVSCKTASRDASADEHECNLISS